MPDSAPLRPNQSITAVSAADSGVASPYRIHLIGVDASTLLSEQAMDSIGGCRALVLSRRHRERLAGVLEQHPHLCLLPIAPVQQALDLIDQELTQGDVAVLASGDPLFFGIGRTLLQLFPPEQIRIIPALSTMQLAFSRFKIPWDDAVFLSLHGRELASLGTLLRHDKLFLFTDQHSSPNLIASTLLAECGEVINAEYTLHVAENLGSPQESLRSGTLTDIAACCFGPLTVLILQKNHPAPQPPPLGLTEAEIQHSRRLITKNEVRAACLHTLRLPSKGVLWDIGAGSGSVGLEAARLFPELQVFAIEQHPEQQENIRINRQRFQAWNLQLIPGSAPSALHALPAPDRIFIGGSGGQLESIVATAVPQLKLDGRVVITAVLEQTASTAPQLLYDQGLEVSLSEIRVTRKQWHPPGAQTPAFSSTEQPPASHSKLHSNQDREGKRAVTRQCMEYGGEMPSAADEGIGLNATWQQIMNPITIISGCRAAANQEHADE